MKSIHIILLILLTGCTALKKNVISDTTNEISSFAESKIIFLNYRVTKALDKTIKINLINKIITEGNLKKKIQKTTNNANNDFVCVQLNKKLLPIDSLQIINPLIKNIEYVKSSGSLGKKQIELDDVEFSVRMQLKPNTKFISLKMINSPNSTLLKIQL